ncbi:MAG: hypothetical protein HYU36_09320 [Planctomycetes bacterium]|nr:hypothetical protein [Planctomycetota bacterium]
MLAHTVLVSSGPLAADGLVVGRGKVKFEITEKADPSQKLLRPAEEAASQPKPKPKIKPKIVIKNVMLQQVIPQTGNNPFHASEPVNNQNGQVVTPGQQQAQQAQAAPVQAQQPVKPAPVPQGPVSLSGVPAFANYLVFTQDVGSAAILVDVANNTTRILPADVTNQNMPDTALFVVLDLRVLGPPNPVQVSPPMSGTFVLADGSSGLEFPNDGSARTGTVRHAATGKQFRITFRPGTTLNGGVNLQEVVLLP